MHAIVFLNINFLLGVPKNYPLADVCVFEPEGGGSREIWFIFTLLWVCKRGDIIFYFDQNICQFCPLHVYSMYKVSYLPFIKLSR